MREAASLSDVFDRVLDKGIVIDFRGYISLVGLHVITVEARVVLASIDTYERYKADLFPARAVIDAADDYLRRPLS